MTRSRWSSVPLSNSAMGDGSRAYAERMAFRSPEGLLSVSRLRFTKGHGTENDFVLLFDPQGQIDLNPELVRDVCDRRAGIGADGVIRAVLASRLDAGTGFAPDTWFMDY